MARTSAKAKKTKQEVIKSQEEAAKNASSKSGGNEIPKNLEDSNKENDESNYEVEKIVHTRMYRGKRQYLVRWKGYSEDSDTWENESNLNSCPEAIEAFKNENITSSDDSNVKEEENGLEGSKGKKGGKGGKHIVVVSKYKKVKNDEEKQSTEALEEASNNQEKAVNKKREKVSKKTPGKKAKVEVAVTSTKKYDENKTSNDSDEESVTDGKNYEVEKILEMHTKRDGSREFLIRWKGYRPSEDTWEPEAHLNCPELIEKFMEKVNKAKNIPARELRESRAQVERFVPYTKSHGRTNPRRNMGARPSYAESYAE